MSRVSKVTLVLPKCSGPEDKLISKFVPEKVTGNVYLGFLLCFSDCGISGNACYCHQFYCNMVFYISKTYAHVMCLQTIFFAMVHCLDFVIY